MSKPYLPTNTEELVECMTIEDAELEGGKQNQRTQRQWAAHVDAVTAAVTTAKVQGHLPARVEQLAFWQISPGRKWQRGRIPDTALEIAEVSTIVTVRFSKRVSS